MVPVSLDVHLLAEVVSSEILRRLEETDHAGEAVEFGWLVYGLRFTQGRNGGRFGAELARLEGWAQSEGAGSRDRDLSPLCLCYQLATQAAVRDAVSHKLRKVVERALVRSDGTKFDVLNDPGQLFCVALSKGALDAGLSGRVRTAASAKGNGRPARKALLEAVRAELSGDAPAAVEVSGDACPEDVATVVWLARRYEVGDLGVLWSRLGQVLPGLQSGVTLKEYGFSNRGLGLLSEAVSLEIARPDPNMVFGLFPFQKEIREIAEEHFRAGRYPSAVLQAAMKLNEFIQRTSANSRASEAELVKSVMRLRQGKPPVIQFNEYLGEDSGKNEQSGLAMIAEGVFTAFRNPKGHKAEDHPLVTLDAYEALSQLIVVDYVWKRVAQAVTQR